ncbi:MAG: geranylgeranyl diphosphate reductase [Pseudomonadota bacterium]
MQAETDTSLAEIFDVVVVGGGPAGATAATDLAKAGRRVALLDRAGRIKPCGGAIPPRLIRDFGIPEHLLVARARSARVIAPSQKSVDMPIDGGFVGMVDRDVFDEWLRERATKAGARRITGKFQRLEERTGGARTVVFEAEDGNGPTTERRIKAKAVIGADGARSQVARQSLKSSEHPRSVFAYHEVIRTPSKAAAGGDEAGEAADYAPTRCDIFYQSHVSPDFYGWVFPHGETASVGVGSAQKGFSLRGAVSDLRRDSGLDAWETVRREGAPIPLKPLKKWDNGEDVTLAGDAAGVVAPASGEGIYYAMIGGRFAAEAVDAFLATGDAKELAGARRRFMKAHGTVFRILGMLQHFWYRNDKRRERFVKICDDPDVQRLTWQAYMNKELVKADPGAHFRIFLKDLGHLFGFART